MPHVGAGDSLVPFRVDVSCPCPLVVAILLLVPTIILAAVRCGWCAKNAKQLTVNKLQGAKVVVCYLGITGCVTITMVKVEKSRNLGRLMQSRLPEMADYGWRRPHVFQVTKEVCGGWVVEATVVGGGKCARLPRARARACTFVCRGRGFVSRTSTCVSARLRVSQFVPPTHPSTHTHTPRHVHAYVPQDVKTWTCEGRLRLMQVYNGTLGYPVSYFLNGSGVEVRQKSKDPPRRKLWAFDTDGDGVFSYSEAVQLCDKLGVISDPYWRDGKLTDKHLRRECSVAGNDNNEKETDASQPAQPAQPAQLITLDLASVITVVDPASETMTEVKDWEWKGILTDMHVEAISSQLSSDDVPVEARQRPRHQVLGRTDSRITRKVIGTKQLI